MKSKIVREAKGEVSRVGEMVEVVEVEEAKEEEVKPKVKPKVKHRASRAMPWTSAPRRMEGLGAAKAPAAY